MQRKDDQNINLANQLTGLLDGSPTCIDIWPINHSNTKKEAHTIHYANLAEIGTKIVEAYML